MITIEEYSNEEVLNDVDIHNERIEFQQDINTQIK